MKPTAGPSNLGGNPPTEAELQRMDAYLFVGLGYEPRFVEGDDPAAMHREMAAALDTTIAEIRSIQREARVARNTARPRWPILILRTPKGWTGRRRRGAGGPTRSPSGTWRENPHANGGVLLKDFAMPDFREYAVDVPKPGGTVAEATRVMGRMLRDVMKRNAEARNFRVMGPDETASNRLDALFEATDRTWVDATLPGGDMPEVRDWTWPY